MQNIAQHLGLIAISFSYLFSEQFGGSDALDCYPQQSKKVFLSGMARTNESRQSRAAAKLKVYFTQRRIAHMKQEHKTALLDQTKSPI